MVARNKVLLFFALILTFLSANSVITFRNYQKLQTNNEWVSHTQQVLVVINQIRNLVNGAGVSPPRKNAEVLSGTRKAEFAQVQELLSSLRTLVSDNPLQEKRTRELEGLVRVSPRSPTAWWRGNNGSNFRAREILAELRQEENRLLGIRTEETTASIRATGISFTLELALAVFFIVCTLALWAQRVRAQVALKQSEANYREIFEKANEAIFVHEIGTGRVLEVNQRAVEMTGYSREELTSAHPADISSGNPGYSREDSGRWMKKALEEGPQVFEWQGRHKDGGLHWIEVSLSRAVIGGKERLLAFFRDIGDRKKAEELARLGQARAIESIKDYAIFMLDPEGKILTWNEGAERLKGYQAEEIIGRNFSVFYTPEASAKGHPRELLEAARREGRVEEEGWRVRKDGSRFLADVVITALRDEKGELRGFIKVSRDVTEIKRAQKELQEKTELLDSVLKTMGDGVVVADEKGNFLVFNPAAEKIAGMGPVEGGTGQWSDKYGVFGPDGVTPCPPEENPLAKAIRGQDTDDVEQFLRNAGNPDGLFVSVTGRPLRDEKGEIRGGVVIVRNITGRKKAEAEIKQTNDFLNAVLENIPNMIFVKDAHELRFVRFNRAGEELLGIPREELIGKNDYDFFPKADADFYIAKDRKTLEEGKLLDIPEETIQTRHQGPRILHTKKFPVLGPDGKPRYLMGISEDITEFKRQEQLTIYTKALEVSNKELQDFVFVVSHDLQEPLRKIQSFGNFLKEEAGPALNETAGDYLARMQDASQRMGRLIEDLLQLTRITSRAKPFEAVELDQVLREVASDLEIRLQETGGKVAAKKLPRISADPAQMHQLFQNLIGNALKFRRGGTAPVVEVEAEVDEGKNLCRIRVKDNGIGFDPKYSEKIFNIFQRLNGSEYEGTGIGLAICRKVVERHKGAIRATAKLGEGATFEITLPLRQS